MSDLIDRQAVCDVLSKEWIKYVPMALDMSLAFVLGKINELPSATPTDMSVIDDIKAEILNMPKTYPHTDHFDDYVKTKDVLAVIDRHIGKENDND